MRPINLLKQYKAQKSGYWFVFSLLFFAGTILGVGILEIVQIRRWYALKKRYQAITRVPTNSELQKELKAVEEKLAISKVQLSKLIKIVKMQRLPLNILKDIAIQACGERKCTKLLFTKGGQWELEGSSSLAQIQKFLSGIVATGHYKNITLETHHDKEDKEGTYKFTIKAEIISSDKLVF